MGENARELLVNGLVDREIPEEAIISNSKLTTQYEGSYPSDAIAYDLSERLSGITGAKGTHVITAHNIYDYVNPPSSPVERFGPISHQRIVFENPEFRGVLYCDVSHNPYHIVAYGPFGMASKHKGIKCESLNEGITLMLLEFFKNADGSVAKNV